MRENDEFNMGPYGKSRICLPSNRMLPCHLGGGRRKPPSFNFTKRLSFDNGQTTDAMHVIRLIYKSEFVYIATRCFRQPLSVQLGYHIYKFCRRLLFSSHRPPPHLAGRTGRQPPAAAGNQLTVQYGRDSDVAARGSRRIDARRPAGRAEVT